MHFRPRTYGWKYDRTRNCNSIPSHDLQESSGTTWRSESRAQCPILGRSTEALPSPQPSSRLETLLFPARLHISLLTVLKLVGKVLSFLILIRDLSLGTFAFASGTLISGVCRDMIALFWRGLVIAYSVWIVWDVWFDEHCVKLCWENVWPTSVKGDLFFFSQNSLETFLMHIWYQWTLHSKNLHLTVRRSVKIWFIKTCCKILMIMEIYFAHQWKMDKKTVYECSYFTKCD